MSLWAITSYFNPAGYRTKLQNFIHFAAAVQRQGVNLLCVSARSGDLPAQRLIHVRAGAILWQKERLLNIALSHLPADCDKVAWLDCDILLENPNWAADASKLLDEVPIVQLFDQVKMLGPDGATMFTYAGFIARRSRKSASRVPGPHGYAWAARRELLDKHGFYDRAIIGGGDVIMGQAIFGKRWPMDQERVFTRNHLADILKWGEPLFLDVICNPFGAVRFVPGAIQHLYHGSPVERRYRERYEILMRHEFDPRVDIAIDAGGCWKWSSDKPELHREVREYFFNRNEDSGLASSGADNDREPVRSTVGGI